MKKRPHGSFCKVHKNTKLGRKYCAVKAKPKKGAKIKTKKKGKKTKRKGQKKGYIWITKLDERTCKKCWSRHGKTYPLSKPPDLAHENCRCQLFML